MCVQWCIQIWPKLLSYCLALIDSHSDLWSHKLRDYFAITCTWKKHCMMRNSQRARLLGENAMSIIYNAVYKNKWCDIRAERNWLWLWIGYYITALESSFGHMVWPPCWFTPHHINFEQVLKYLFPTEAMKGVSVEGVQLIVTLSS